jgi:hypothetical protein
MDSISSAFSAGAGSFNQPFSTGNGNIGGSTEKKSSISIILWIALFILLGLFIASLIWLINARSALKKCETTESSVCPSFFCGDLDKSGTPGTPCWHPNDKDKGKRVAFRKAPDGTLQCQNYTIPPNTVTNTDYSTYTSPSQFA